MSCIFLIGVQREYLPIIRKHLSCIPDNDVCMFASLSLFGSFPIVLYQREDIIIERYPKL